MATGTIVMIVCAVLYGLIVILFSKEDTTTNNVDNSLDDPLFMGFDGTPGACDLFAEDVEIDFTKHR